MNDFAIRAWDLSKLYYIGGQRKQQVRFGEQLADVALAPLRRAGKLLRGQLTGAAELDESFWALKDVSFEIPHGEVVGILGHNGAGKSTLLKILSRITEPTAGYVDICGRVSSLLEVGTGFHPELTGRENIYLNGAILGMQRSEIDRKFDDIVDFAEVDQFIDTPVKHYSSGMYVRLAFSVAAHLEPEILLVDEVLAVGDVAFQRKCLGKMDSVSKQGRTVIFVSHNMNALQRLCTQVIHLHRGKVAGQGATGPMIEQYLASSAAVTAANTWIDLSAASRSGGKVRLAALSYSSGNPATAYQPYPQGPLNVSLDIVADQPRSVGSIAVTLYDRYGTKLVNADTLALGREIQLQVGHNRLQVRLDTLHLNPGIYTLGLWVADPPIEVHDSIPSAITLEVIETETEKIRVQEDGVVPCRFVITASP